MHSETMLYNSKTTHEVLQTFFVILIVQYMCNRAHVNGMIQKESVA